MRLGLLLSRSEGLSRGLGRPVKISVAGFAGEEERAEYREERYWLGLVQVQVGIPGKIYPADSVKVAFAFFLDARTLSGFSSSSHVVDVVSREPGA